MSLGAGCAGQRAVVQPPAAPPPPVAAAPAPPPPKKMKMAVLPVEKLILPKVAAALNERLVKASVGGVSETTTATISMDVARMQLDCAQATNECYRQIAKHFEADRLLWAEIERAARAKKKKGAPTTIRIVLFDVERAAVVGRAEQTFTGNVSNEALDQMLSRAISEADAPAKEQP